MSHGWIYLKKDVNTNGTARGYNFGLTSNKKRRDQDYRTENPSIEHIEHFEETKGGMTADLSIGLGVVLALPALVTLYYIFVAFRFGIPVAILTVGVVLCVFIYRYGMNLARERGEI